ncbi:hypothetical protein [Pseudoclavibacter soli]|uniref:hypothetical protein n=1 Tax=Pseudoclavibacter soli TaxID=452623 RepID=UPI0003FF50CC|nr:hypothetical protein [Pseudoclavibacter soli]
MTTSNGSLTLDEANALFKDLKTRFDQSEITSAELRGAVYDLVASISTDQVDGYTLQSGYTTVLYSGAGGTNTLAKELAETNKGNVAIIDNSVVGKFLND